MQISSYAQQHWQHITKDKQLDPQELNQFKETLQREQPGLSTQDLDAQIQSLIISVDDTLSLEQAQLILNKVSAGETLSIAEFVPHDMNPSQLSFGGSSIDPLIHKQWDGMMADGVLSPGEYNRIRNTLNVNTMGVAANQLDQVVDDKIKTLLRKSMPWATGQEIANKLNELKSGIGIDTQQPKTPSSDPLVVDLGLDVEDAEITDHDGVHKASKDDITGTVGKADLDIGFDTQRAQAFLDSKKALIQKQIEAHIKSVGDDKDLSVSGAWEALKDLAATDGSAERISQVLAEHLKVQQVDNGDGTVSYEVKLDPAYKDKLGWTDQTRLSAAGFDDTETFAKISAPDGNLKLELGDTLASSFGEVDPASGKTQLETEIDAQLAELEKQGIHLDVEVVKEGDSYTLKPNSLKLKEPALSQILQKYPHLANGELDLKSIQTEGEVVLPNELFEVKLTEKGIELDFENLQISGSSDAKGEQTEIDGQGGTTVSVDKLDADATAEVNPETLDVDLKNLSLSELSARLAGDVKVTAKLVETVKEKVQAALSQLDKKLETYGLSRAHLEKIIKALPTDALASLVQSASQNQVNDLAAQLNLSEGQLTAALRFLSEEPVQQVLGDLHQLSERLAMDTTLSGELSLSLQDLSLSPNEQGWMGMLGGLTAALDAKAVSPDGKETDLNASVTASDAKVETDPDGKPIAGEVGKTEVTASATDTTPEKTPEQKIEQFVQALQNGGGPYRGQGERSGHLKDEGDSKLREGSGLTLDEALQDLKKAPPGEWAKILNANESERQDFYKKYGIDKDYDDYLVRYINTYVLPGEPPGESVTVKASVEGAKTGPDGTTITGAHVEAEAKVSDADGTSKVSAEADVAKIDSTEGDLKAEDASAKAKAEVVSAEGERTTAEADAKIDAIKAEGDQVLGEDVEAFMQNLAQANSPYRVKAGDPEGREGYLVDEKAPAGIRGGMGITADTALNELKKAPAAEWEKYIKASPAEQREFFERHGITNTPELPAGDYLLKYLDRYVVNGSGVSAEGIQGSAKVSSDGKGSPKVDVAVEVKADTGHADDSGADLQSATVNGSISSGDTSVKASTDPSHIHLDEEGMDTTTKVRVEGATGDRTRVTGKTETEVTVENGKITGTHTDKHDARGKIVTDTGVVFDVLDKNSPALGKYFREHGILGTREHDRKQVTFDVTNTGEVTTDENNEFDKYQVRLATGNMETRLGPVAASVYIDDDKSITGDIELKDPSKYLTDQIKDQLNAVLNSSSQKGQIAVKSVQIVGDRVEIVLDGKKPLKFSLDVNVSFSENGNLQVDMDSIELKNKFLNGAVQVLGLEDSFLGLAKNKFLNSMKEDDTSGLIFGSSGKTSIEINTNSLLKSMFGPEASNVRIRNPRIENGQIKFGYNIN